MNVLDVLAATAAVRSLSICESSFDLQFSLSDTSDDEKMQSMLKIKLLMTVIYHWSPRYVYDDSLFLFHDLLCASMYDHSVWSVIIVDSRYSVEA